MCKIGIYGDDQVLTFNDKATALLVSGSGSSFQGEEVILTVGTFDAADRQKAYQCRCRYYHRWLRSLPATAEPVMTGLDGDVIQVPAGQKVLLDQGGQFTVSDEMAG